MEPLDERLPACFISEEGKLSTLISPLVFPDLYRAYNLRISHPVGFDKINHVFGRQMATD